MTFAEKVKDVRAKLNLTQEELAKQLGVAFATINRWEKGNINPSNSAKKIFEEFCQKNNIEIEDIKKQKSLGISLITAQQLQEWFSEQSNCARGIFPELIKRLIKESISGKINKLVFPSGDKVNISGVDGELDVDFGNQFVPNGTSYWEIGSTVKNVKGKFKSDYKKRTQEFTIVEKSKLTFVFVTPATLNAAGKKSLLHETENDGWKGVNIIDAIILEEWLSCCLQTSIWLIEFFEKNNLSLQTLKGAHSSLMKKTTPNLVDNFFLYAREKEKESFISLIQNKSVIKIGSNSKEDSYGFALSSLYSDFEKYEQKCIVCNDIDTLQELDKLVSGYILILNSYIENYDLSLNNKYIIVYGANCINDTNVDLKLNVRSFYDLSEVLKKDMGVNNEKVAELSHKASISIPLIMRELRSENYYHKNDWIDDIKLQDLIPIMLLGKVDFNNQFDIDFLSEFLSNGETCNDYWNKILYWKKVDNSPLFFYDKAVKVVLKEELWIELKDHISNDLICTVYNCIQTYFDSLESDNLLRTNNWTGTDYLLTGLLDTCILLSIYNDESNRVDTLIEALLNNCDTTNKVKGFAKYLTLLAECAPQKFLEYIEKEINKTNSLLMKLFATKNTDFIGSNYCYILWSLEYLVCLDVTKFSACDALFNLHKKKFVYRTTNSPLESLYNQLVYINNRNALSFEDKKKYLLSRLDKFGSSFGEIVLDVLFKNVAMFTNDGLKWRNRDFVTETISRKDIWDLQSDCIKKLLDIMTNTEYKYIYRLVDYFDYLTPKSMERLKQYIVENYKENIEIYNYLTVRKYHVERFNIQDQRQHSSDSIFTEILNVIMPQDKLKSKLVYFKDFSYDGYPDIRIENQNYQIRADNVLSARVKLFEELKTEYSYKLVLDELLTVLPNNSLVGCFLSKISMDEEEKQYLIKKLESERLETLSTFLSYQSEDYIKSYLLSRDEDFLIRFVKLMSNGNIIPDYLFDNEKIEKEFYKHREFRDTLSEKEALKIKVYNPISYLRYLSRKTLNFSDVAEVKTILKGMSRDHIKDHLNIYTVQHILSILDEAYYDNDVVEICIKYIQLFEDRIMPRCINRYISETPQEFVRIHTLYYNDSIDHEYAFKVRMYFSFPEDMNMEAIQYFVSEVMRYGSEVSAQKNLMYELGAVLARTFIGSRNFRMPLILKKLLEQLNNDSVNDGAYYGYITSLGMRQVTDGTPELELAKRYKQEVNDNLLEYPNAAKVLSKIASSLENDSQRDKEMNLVMKGIL